MKGKEGGGGGRERVVNMKIEKGGVGDIKGLFKSVTFDVFQNK